MSVHISNFRDPDARMVYMKPAVFFAGLAVLVVVGLVFMFHEAVGDYFSSFSPAPANSIRGQWIGVLSVSALSDEYVHIIHKQAVIRFSLKPTDHYLHKYGGSGEITIADDPPLPVEVKDLWPSGKGPGQTFEVGIWMVPYKQGDLNDRISGGYEGAYSPGVLTLKRQIDRGYEMQGTLHKGTDQEYLALVQQMKAQSKVDGKDKP